ncbi:MAG: NifU N-terminal domain-containing protein, partial [Gemmatimonadales bacterium]
MMDEIRVTAEPVDNVRCKFVVNRLLYPGGLRRFTSAAEAKGSPLAEAIFATPELDVAELIVSGNLVTVVKQAPAPWQTLG